MQINRSTLHGHIDRIRKDVDIVAGANNYRFDRASRGTFHHCVDVALHGSSELALLCSGGRYSRFWNVANTLPAMDFEANYAKRLAESFHSELT